MAFQKTMALLESDCKLLFPKPSTFPIRLGEVWNARYFGTDIYLTLAKGELTYSRFPYGPFNIPVPLANGQIGPQFKCEKPALPW